MLALAEARDLILNRLRDRAVAPRVASLDEAFGAALADDLLAPRDVPGFAHAAMDGYAARAADLRDDAPTALRLIGTQLAGRALNLRIASGQCVRIATGAILPEGADTVVIRENARVDGDQITLEPGTPFGANVRSASDDYAQGDRVFARGQRLGAAPLAVLASFGVDRVSVRRARVAVLVTGDELVPPGQALATGLRHDSNSTLLAGLLRAHGAEISWQARIADSKDALREALREASTRADLILTTGGASVGEADHMPRLVAELGEVFFHKVAMRPGMPALFGAIGGTPLLALPGNPVSVAATFIAFARPALASLCACAALDPAPWTARLAAPLRKDHHRAEFRRARVIVDGEGVLHVEPHASLSSGALRSVAESEAFVRLPEHPGQFAIGDRLPCHRLSLD